jgi:hypothetical protein
VFEGLEGLVLLPHKFRLPGHKKKLKGGIHIAAAGERGMYDILGIGGQDCLFREDNVIRLEWIHLEHDRDQ